MRAWAYESRLEKIFGPFFSPHPDARRAEVLAVSDRRHWATPPACPG